MFRSHAPVAEADEIEQGGYICNHADLLRVSHLGLDLAAPGDGWAAYLIGRGIPITEDDLGRPCISRADAKQLFDERREHEARQREVMQQNEQRAIEADQQWRALLPHGAAWWQVPDGVHPATAMLQQAKDAQPRRTPTTNEWLFNEVDDTMVYHPLPAEDEAS